MKKIIAILMLSTLALFIITGCQSNKATAPESKTQTTNQATGNVVDNQAINEASETTQALDTTQVDKDLGTAATSLNNW